MRGRRIRNRQKLRSAGRKLRPHFEEMEMERESVRRVSRLVREGVISVPAELEMVGLAGHSGKVRRISWISCWHTDGVRVQEGTGGARGREYHDKHI